MRNEKGERRREKGKKRKERKDKGEKREMRERETLILILNESPVTVCVQLIFCSNRKEKERKRKRKTGRGGINIYFNT